MPSADCMALSPSYESSGRRLLARRRFAGLLLLALVLGAHTAWAVDASDYLLLPTVVQGEREIDWRTGIASVGATTSSQADYAIGVGYGVTARWFTEVAVHSGQRQGSTLQIRDVAWENILQLAEPGEWPLDIGISFEVERSQRSQDQLDVTGGALLQKEFGIFQANLNILLNHVIEGTELATTRVQFQGQLKYRYSEPFEFGVQAFSYVSSYRATWAPYSDQVHRVGPVALGKLKFGRERSLAYNAAFLFGTTGRSPDRTLRFQIEYEF
jgi:hypothetical protein